LAPPKPPRRASRRLAQRQHVRDLDRLARLAPGGAPDRPIEIDTPAVVDVMAEARRCPLCDGPLHLREHTAETIAGQRLRVAHVKCASCGIAREIYFRLTAPVLN
jgi:hypothetical protein